MKDSACSNTERRRASLAPEEPGTSAGPHADHMAALWPLLMLVLVHARSLALASLLPYDLRVDRVSEPLGVDSQTPLFSWKLSVASTEQDIVQTAYQLQLFHWNASATLPSNPTDRAAFCQSTSLAARVTPEMDQSGSYANLLWDSGPVSSRGARAQLPSSVVLTADTYYLWCVRVWDNSTSGSQHGDEPAAAAYSPAQLQQREQQLSNFTASIFSVGLLTAVDWYGSEWITGGWQYRTEVDLLAGNGSTNANPVTVTQALAYISGLGWFECWLNGARIGQNYLDPGWTNYEARALYVVHDVTALLPALSSNAPPSVAIACALGGGHYSLYWLGSDQSPSNVDPAASATTPAGSAESHSPLFPQRTKLLLRLSIHYSDGSTQSIQSDGATWRVVPPGAGAYKDNSVYGGDVYDARDETIGWLQPGYIYGRVRISACDEHSHTLYFLCLSSPYRAGSGVTAVKLGPPWVNATRLGPPTQTELPPVIADGKAIKVHCVRLTLR